MPNIAPLTGYFTYFFTYNNTSDNGYNIISPGAEMAYMFYQNLGNSSDYDTAGNSTYCQGISRCLQNTGPFENLMSFEYWTSVSNDPNPRFAWRFGTLTGRQARINKTNEYHAWAVRSGDVAHTPAVVPVPAAIWLFGSALLGLVGFRKR